MNDREKMIELIQDAVGGCARHWAKQIADHLLANGVGFVPGESIAELHLSARSYNALRRAGINTIEDLKALDEKSLMRIRGMGRSLVDEALGELAEWEKRAAKED